MSWEDVDQSFDHTRPEDIVIHLDLSRFGEFVGRVASEVCRMREIEPFDVNSEEARHIAVDAWRYVCHMADRAEFEQSVAKDLDALGTPEPERKGPFGFESIPVPDEDRVRRGTESLERRLEPPV